MANKKASSLATLLIIIIILNLLILSTFLFWFYQEKIKKPQTSPSPSPSPVITPSIKPTPQPTSAPSIMPSPTPFPTPPLQTKSDLELIKEAFAEKYDKPLADVEVNIDKQTGPYASGGVRFAGEMGGGMWLAYKDCEEWVIVHDGHGTISCEAIEPYDFPVDIVPECFRESDGTVVERS